MRSLPLLLLIAIFLLTAPPLLAEEAEPVDDAAAMLARFQEVISADLQRNIERSAAHRVDRVLEAALRDPGTSMDCVQMRLEHTECRVIAAGRRDL